MEENNIQGSESELNLLFQEILTGCREDLSEANKNVELYLDELYNESKGGDRKILYGPIYNEALKLKGDARDRQLKFLNMFKDRVTKKEILQSNKKEKDPNSDFPDISKLNTWVDDMKLSKVLPVISNDEIDYKEEEIEPIVLENEDDLEIDLDEEVNESE